MANGTRDALEKAGHEIKVNPPKILARTAAKYGPERARKQRIAIMLSKARKSGASIAPLKAPNNSLKRSTAS
jgi:hypothetical protein